MRKKRGRVKQGVEKACLTCGKKFYIFPSWVGNRGLFDTRECYRKFMKKTFS